MSDQSGDEDRDAILARRQRFIALALGGLATGCAPPLPSADGGTTTSMGPSTTGPSTTGETGSETQTEGELDTSATITTTFVLPDPQPCLSSECDPFAQDCPEGEKCVPYASTGESWDANKCVPVQGDEPAGAPCTYDGVADATDDCDESTHCWDVQDVDGVLTGVCTSFCSGTADDWICDEGSVCLIANEGSVALCIAACDPLMQDCGEGLGCSWNGQTFGCLVTTTGLAVGEVCAYANDCAAGRMCVAAAASPICAGEACCIDYCSVDDPQSCGDPQLECLGFFDQGQAPAGLDALGICVVLGACDGAEPCPAALTIDS